MSSIISLYLTPFAISSSGTRLVSVELRGRIVDVRLEYPDDFSAQMLEYADRYAFLPTWN
jgi:hypothetical protein